MDDSLLPPRKTPNDPPIITILGKDDGQRCWGSKRCWGPGRYVRKWGKYICKETGWSLPYKAVGVLGAGAAAGALAMAAVTDVRPETSTVTLLCTHRLCHCERGKRERRLWRSGTHEDTQHRQLPQGIRFNGSGGSAVGLENSHFSHKTLWRGFFILKQLHLLSTREQLELELPGNIWSLTVTSIQIKHTFKRTSCRQEPNVCWVPVFPPIHQLQSHFLVCKVINLNDPTSNKYISTWHPGLQKLQIQEVPRSLLGS